MPACGPAMVYYLFKILLSAIIIVAISETAKRSSPLSAWIAALPITSMLALIWLHVEAAPAGQIADLSQQIFWLVIPSLLFFLTLPVLLRLGINFWASLGLSIVVTALSYALTANLLRRFGVEI